MFGSIKKMKLGGKFITAFLLVGIVPFAVIGFFSLDKAGDALHGLAFDQLESIRNIKKNQVVQYLDTLENQALTFTENRMVIDAMKAFKKAGDGYVDEKKLNDSDIENLRSKLARYYEGDFSKAFGEKNNGRTPDAGRILNSLDSESVALQFAYIQDNPHPLGEKDKLDSATDDTEYSRLHRVYHPIIRNYLKKFGYYDIFLVDGETGRIVYSVFKELDFSTSLMNGPYANTNFAEAFKKANAAMNKDAVVVADFKPYFPSYEAPAAFIASPIFDGNEKIGIGMFQFPIDNLNAIMRERSGMGQSGESYLVGSDLLMRSDSFLDPENHSIVGSFRNPEKGKVDTRASREALEGKTDKRIIIDYNGNPVLSAFTPIPVGGTTWALIAEIDEAEAFAAVTHLKWLMGIIALVGLAAIVFVALLMTRAITRPIKMGVSFAKAMSEGDLTQTLDIERSDEIGILAGSLNQMAANLREMFQDVVAGIETLTSSSTELSAISSQMAAGSEQARGKSDMVAAAAEEMSTSMQTMAQSSEEASTNVQMVAAASEEMSATIGEIAGNTEKGRVITSDAVKSANRASEKIEQLGTAAKAVGKVTESINEISEQTNLLALNATIEAARAGDAGKGFAVVANEIKELAKMTAMSTQDIRSRIEGIQGTTAETVSEIRQIETVIVQIDEIVSTIASSVEEQSVSTREIAGNIAQAANGIQGVNENVSQSSMVANGIAKDLEEVNQAAREIAGGSGQVKDSAEELSRLAEQLNGMVRRFRL